MIVKINNNQPETSPRAQYNPNARSASSAFSIVRSRSHADWRPFSLGKWERFHARLMDRVGSVEFDAVSFSDACQQLSGIQRLRPIVIASHISPRMHPDVVCLVQWGLNVVSVVAEKFGRTAHHRVAHIISGGTQNYDVVQDDMFNGRCVLTIKTAWLQRVKEMLDAHDWSGFWNLMSATYRSLPDSYNLRNPSYVRRETGQTTTARRAEARGVTAARRLRPLVSSPHDVPSSRLARHYAEHDPEEHVSKADIVAFLAANDVAGPIRDKVWEALIASVVGREVEVGAAVEDGE